MTNPREQSPERSEPVSTGTIQANTMRTRDRVFGTLGTIVDLSTDAMVFGAQATGYVIGQGIHGTATGAWEIVQGVKNKPFKRAA